MPNEQEIHSAIMRIAMKTGQTLDDIKVELIREALIARGEL